MPKCLMRIMKLAKYRLKAQVEKDEGPSGEGQSPEWRRVKTQVDKDEGLEAETLSRLLIVPKGPNCLEGPLLVFDLNKKNFWQLIKIGESFSPGSLLNQSQTYQGNPCGVCPDLSSFTGSGCYPDLSSFAGSGVNQKLYSLYQAIRAPGVYPDLSSFTGSGVYPDLSSFTGSGVYPDLSSFTGSGVYPDLSSFIGSGVIQTFVTCIKRSAP
ncbi:hypothetical protein HKD37_05G013329 [Glycine soja]